MTDNLFKYIVKSFILLFISLFISIGLISAEDLNKKKIAEIKIGSILGLTGNASVHSDAIRKGITLAVESLRKEGVLVDVKYEDDQTNPAKTVSSAKFLIANGYKYFIGPTWSFQAKAVESVLKANDAIALLPAGSSLINGGSSEVFFNLCPRRDKQEPVIVDWLESQKGKFKKAIIITPNGDWGEVHNEVFVNAVKKSGIEVVSVQNYDYGIDINSIKSMLLREKSKDFDIIFVTGSPFDTANIFKAKNQLNINIPIVGTHDLVDAVDLGILSKNDLIDNAYVVHLKAPSMEFQSKFKEKFKESAKLYSDRGHDAVLAIVKAIQETDGTSDAVRDYLKNKINITGAVGKINFDSNGDLDLDTYELVPFSSL